MIEKTFLFDLQFISGDIENQLRVTKIQYVDSLSTNVVCIKFGRNHFKTSPFDL